MIVVNVEQGSPSWFTARLGIPTASCFSKIITAGGKPSTQSEGYIDECLAEWLAGTQVDEGFTSKWMEDGKRKEAEARKQYEFISGNTVDLVGFCTLDDGTVGCSPDGLVSNDGLSELKCPKASTMISYYRKGFPRTYWPQVQGQMWVCEREFCDFYAYHEKLKPFMVRIERDEPYIALMANMVKAFVAKMDVLKAELAEWRVAV